MDIVFSSFLDSYTPYRLNLQLHSISLGLIQKRLWENQSEQQFSEHDTNPSQGGPQEVKKPRVFHRFGFAYEYTKPFFVPLLAV